MRNENVLGNRVKYYRKQRGLTQEQLAEKVSTSLSFIQVTEAGKDIPSIELFLKIAEVLDVQPNQLLSFDKPVPMDAVEEYKQLSLSQVCLAASIASSITSALLDNRSGIKQNIGKRLSAGRLSKKMPRKVLAEKIGKSADQVGKIEAGVNFTTLNTLKDAMQVLEIPIEYVLQDECKAAGLYVLNDILTDANYKMTTAQYALLRIILKNIMPLFDEQ